MILAFDTYYFDNKARTVGLAFEHWTATEHAGVYTEVLENSAAYEPGAFYKRELPCILSLLKKIDVVDVEAIVVDGFVYLDDDGTPGLGGHLFRSLGESVPVIGVAKSNFATLERNKRVVYRAGSKRPLYITAVGIDRDEAAAYILSMAGAYRLPALLKRLDRFTKEKHPH